MLSAKQFASGEGRLADVRGERCDFAVVGARKCSAAGGSPCSLGQAQSSGLHSIPSFSAQYQQSPIPPGGTIIKRKWLTTYDDVSIINPATASS
jgi:hypothetical protein